VLVEAACMAGKELTVLPPLFVAETPGGLYSTAMARCYEP